MKAELKFKNEFIKSVEEVERLVRELKIAMDRLPWNFDIEINIPETGKAELDENKPCQ